MKDSHQSYPGCLPSHHIGAPSAAQNDERRAGDAHELLQIEAGPAITEQGTRSQSCSAAPTVCPPQSPASSNADSYYSPSPFVLLVLYVELDQSLSLSLRPKQLMLWGSRYRLTLFYNLCLVMTSPTSETVQLVCPRRENSCSIWILRLLALNRLKRNV